MLALLSAACARTRGRLPAKVAAPASVRKSRRRMVMRVSPRVVTASTYFHVLPAGLLAGGLADRSLGQRLGFLGRCRCLVELAGICRLLRRRQRVRRRGPLVAQLRGLLVGGVSR